MSDLYKNDKGEVYAFSPLQVMQGAAEGYTKLTEEEIEERNKPVPPTEEEVRSQRDYLIAETDWTQLSDVPSEVTAEYVEYRQALRDVPQQKGFPEKVEWPVKPEL